MATLCFDIEVAGFPWEEVDAITRGYLLEREPDAAKREAIPERMALYPGMGRIIAIGLWAVEGDRGIMLMEGEGGEQDWEKVPNAKIFRGPEKQLLQRFWEIVDIKAGRGRYDDADPLLVSFNGRHYDGPMLMVRSAQLGLRPSRNLLPYRYRLNDHVDLCDALTFMGAYRDRFSLDYWCRRFDVESPKGSIDGSQVSRVYREGRIEDIGEYCLRDCRATAQLYARLDKTLLPLIAAGS